MARSRQQSRQSSTTTAPQASGPTASGPGNAANQGALAQQDATSVVVGPGDTLWGIAARELADGSRWDEVAELNAVADPSLIFPGQVLQLPVDAVEQAPEAEVAPQEVAPSTDAPAVATTELGQAPLGDQEAEAVQEAEAGGSLWDRVKGVVDNAVETVKSFFSGWFGGKSEDTPEVTPEEGPTEAPKAPETPDVQEDTPEPIFHTVYPGDNLWSIARQYLGDGDRWREIADANGLDNPSLLKVGQKLLIPGATPAPVVQPVTPGPSPDRPDAPADPGGGNMQVDDPINLAGLRGLDRTMADIYNTKGRYLKTKASELGISAAAAAAVLKCESGGEGFHRESGDMIIRFENHIFWDQWGKRDPTTFHQHFQYSSGKRWTGHKFRASETDAWMSFHGNQSKEWTVLDLARSLDDTAALKSISMGAAQIMGFNFQTLGYASVQDMFDSMAGSLPSQLDGMFAFIQANRTCMAGLRSGNYTQFARGYNGPGQAETYGSLISNAAASYARVTRGRSQA